MNNRAKVFVITMMFVAIIFSIFKASMWMFGSYAIEATCLAVLASTFAFVIYDKLTQ